MKNDEDEPLFQLPDGMFEQMLRQSKKGRRKRDPEPEEPEIDRLAKDLTIIPGVHFDTKTLKNLPLPGGKKREPRPRRRSGL